MENASTERLLSSGPEYDDSDDFNRMNTTTPTTTKAATPSLATVITGVTQQQQQQPPQTPPLPVQYTLGLGVAALQAANSQHMNGSAGNGLNHSSSIANNSAATAAANTTNIANSSAAITPTNNIINSNNSNNNNNNNNNNNISINSNSSNNNNNVSGGGVIGGGGGGVTRLASSRRPQIQISPSEPQKTSQLLTLTIHKDENGYGMKVSGDNPVYVESVKPGGAAQVAGLIAGDMILKVNGQEVRSEKHTTVVSLIKSHIVVDLAVKRSHKMQRPSSVGIGPATPILSTRDRTASITGPQPVDNAKRREMESYKIKTLQLMLEQEKKNLERLKGDSSNPSYKTSETNIRKLKEQLRQVGGEESPTGMKFQNSASQSSVLSPSQILQQHYSPHQPNPPTNIHHFHHPATTPQAPPHTSPAFLSLLPRSLSSLSLGTRKKPDKEITSPLSNTTDFLNASSTTNSPSPLLSHSMSQSLHQQKGSPQPQQFYPHHLHQQQQQAQLQQHQSGHSQKYNKDNAAATPKSSVSKKKFSGSTKNLKEDIPPPLPQRNPPRNLLLESANMDWRRNVPVSDLDHSTMSSPSSTQRGSPTQITSGASGAGPQKAPNNAPASGGKKRPKTKTKALSDPKMSTQMFLQMEKAPGTGEDGDDDHCIPPPLPPRQPGMMEESQNILNSNKKQGNNFGGRPPPNSIDTLMNYPLVTTCTPVRDNMSAAFPLSQRPNIVQQLQQHQQMQNQMQHHGSSGGTAPPLPPPAMQSSSSSAALGQTPQNMNHFGKHRRVVSSPDNMHPRHERQLDRHNKSTSGSWELVEKDNEITPPGTPPPPYLTSASHAMAQQQHQQQQLHHQLSQPAGGCMEEIDNGFMIDGNNSGNPMMVLAGSPTHSNIFASGGGKSPAIHPNAIQKEILSMEDEDGSDQEFLVDENGPFNHLQRLLETENVAHLAVFLNYVLSNSDPAPLLFYLITGLYKEGTVKDMRKWAYEIHSTFLVPRAPLVWFSADESLAREVDNVLQSEYDKVEILRKVFWKSRKRAKEKICDQLREFQQKRTAGLGTIYGPSDSQLNEAKGDKNKEQRIFEETLLPRLQFWIDELDKEAPVEDPKKLALCSALSTVLHRIFITRSNPNSIIDRVHHFVSREKSFKSRLMGKNRKMTVRGHPLVLRQYYEVTHCNHCQLIIWGVSPQGYHCTDCKLNIHRPCSKVLDENCPGPVPQKRKDQHNDNKISKFMEKIRPTTHFMQQERRARQDEECSIDELINPERLHSTSIVRQPSDRRPDVANTSISSSGNTSYNTSELQTSQSLDADTNALDAEKDTKRDRSKSKSAPVSVNRSESYKERLSHKRNRNNRRKTSDPSLSSKPNDDQPDLGLSNSNYTASSNSSLSSGGGSESPSTSMEQVGGPVPIPTTITTHISNNLFNSNVANHSNLATGPNKQWVDSDDDDDLANEVDWSSNIAAEVLAALTDAEKKRQEIINEIYQTERSHVRTLKLLEGIFMRPLQECGVLPHDHLHLLFPPALLSLKELHSSFEQKLKLRRLEHNHIVQHVGDLLAGMFDGQSGEELREHAAKFCARQQIALEALKEKRRKDENLQRFLTKAESHRACRRLQLKDLLPTVLQRLTKYPLLFENLYKITKRVVPDDHVEAEAVQRALDYSKRILVDVNQAVKIAEDAHKLQTIQRKLDRSTFDKEEFRNLDLTQLKLIHDGGLTMKKNPGTQLHGLLFENMLLLLTKQDDKYALKNFQNISATGTTEVNKFISPITCFDQQTLVRQSAVDKNTFFLIITKTSQMLELRAPSSSECKTWFKHISDAAEQYKQRSKSSHEVVDDPASATLPHSNTKESLESTPERQTPSTATATTTTTTTNNNVSDRESTPAPDKNRTSLPNNNNSLDIGGGSSGGGIGNSSISRDGGSFASGSRSRSISRSGSRNESNNNDYDSPTSTDEQKLRQQLLSAAEEAAAAAAARRDNSSLYSNNSNNTRTLMQNSPLVEPSAIQISISPAHTAEPVLTPSERLKRLDSSIRENLVEKQKIICDMFRLPIEHFNEIVDIAAQPEAPKDSSDIALAAYAQVQSLTEVLNDYMKINSTEQEISAVSTVVCDQCHQTQAQKHSQQLHHLGNVMTSSSSGRPVSPVPLSATSTNTTMATTVVLNDTAPSSNAPAIPTSPAVTSSASNNILTNSNSVEVDQIIHEDDDGYCEIDELRLPSVPLSKIPTATATSTAGGSSGGTFKAPLPIGVAAEIAATRASTTPELIKRQSTISTDSIPEESEHDMTQLDEPTLSSSVSLSKTTTTTTTSSSSKDEVEAAPAQKQPPHLQHQQSGSNGSIDPSQLDISSSSSLLKQRNYTEDSLDSEHIEINDAYDTMTAVNKLHNLTLNDGNVAVSGSTHQCISSSSPGPILCGPNRLLHANSLEPSVPCHLINGIVSTLNSQISLLLPKINERDLERERLRRENQHLRELLNAMHERQRVEANMETPAEITKSADASNETIITPALGEEHKTTTDQTP
ncbi:uncharacterized protein LOC129918418 isoform X2 [Episyrphus balteatus]|uniref:uncharacterized protein LOC129918418 isoform X2 n=1 Tax=Episyrphus balteatus TaxID=286459 RepID=UPI0024850F1A|nr:uncharacterized protein LOC129918418 isoform X2 [Episyrphus balteatus]